MFRVVVGKGYNLRDNRDDDLFRNHHSFANILKVQYAPSLHLSLKEIVSVLLGWPKSFLQLSYGVEKLKQIFWPTQYKSWITCERFGNWHPICNDAGFGMVVDIYWTKLPSYITFFFLPSSIPNNIHMYFLLSAHPNKLLSK